ncbi:MAG: metallophosphoesterase [archaeon]
MEGILSYSNEKRVLVNKDALTLLNELEEWKDIVDKAALENVFVIDANFVEKNKRIKHKEPLNVELKKTWAAEAKNMEANYKILDEYNVNKDSFSKGKVADFLIYFQDKFKFLDGLLRKHQITPKETSRLKAIPNKSEVDVIGMVNRKWTSKNGHLAIELEDFEGKCIGLVMKKDEALLREAELAIPDSVIAIKGTKLSNELIIAKAILFPDVQIKSEKTIAKDVSIAGISDMHIGSKLFQEKTFENFLKWINGNANEYSALAENVKYLVITGDNVDGIGIYPNQYDELAVKSISKQYEIFTELILQIPKYIEIFIIPGQHDAVRWADPQPQIPEEMAPELYKQKNIHFLSSPGWVNIEGLKIMLYHGPALHDLFSQVSYLNASRPAKGMASLVKRRDLMCGYGLSRPYVPENIDYMVMREEPDLVFMGEHHRFDTETYRGVTVVNNSTFQAQTAYQAELGHIPTPGIVSVINLKTRKLEQVNLNEF